jgi:preprotein translocase subunit SecE
MAKNEALGGFWISLVSPGIYKRTQGKRCRQLTAGLLIVWSVFGCLTLYNGPLLDADPGTRIGIPLVLGIVSVWLSFRLVNYPQFADFLIAVEAEMKKVSWPSLQQCFRAATVVIVTMFLLAIILFAYDRFWIWFFTLVKVLRISA